MKSDFVSRTHRLESSTSLVVAFMPTSNPDNLFPRPFAKLQEVKQLILMSIVVSSTYEKRETTRI